MQDWIGGGRRGAQTEGSIIRGDDEVQKSKCNGSRYYVVIKLASSIFQNNPILLN